MLAPCDTRILVCSPVPPPILWRCLCFVCGDARVDDDADKGYGQQLSQIKAQTCLEEPVEARAQEAEEQEMMEEEPMQPHQPPASMAGREDAQLARVSALSQYLYGHSIDACPCCRVWQPMREDKPVPKREGAVFKSPSISPVVVFDGDGAEREMLRADEDQGHAGDNFCRTRDEREALIDLEIQISK